MKEEQIKSLFYKLVNNKELMLQMPYSKHRRHQYRHPEKYPIKMHTIFNVLYDFGIISTTTGDTVESLFDHVIRDEGYLKKLKASKHRLCDWRNPDRKKTLIGSKVHQLYKLGLITFNADHLLKA